MKIAFYLTPGRKKNLYCRISDGKERVTFSLEYPVDAKKWDSKKEMLDDDDVHYYTLLNLKSHLTRKYHSLKTDEKDNILSILKNESESLMANEGLDGVAKTLFNLENGPLGVPPYDDFLKAFEKHSGLKRKDYKVQPLDELIHFHTEDEVFVMDTYAGLHARLKGFVESKSYSEIYTETEAWIWGEIYIDTGIEKHKFMPVMLSVWESFWIEEYQTIKEKIGPTDHLDEMKNRSWRKLQVFMECYDDADNIIELATEIDEMDLYPMAVITMLKIFDADTCYEEYCEHELEQPDIWESISLGDMEAENWNGPIFHIQPYDF